MDDNLRSVCQYDPLRSWVKSLVSALSELGRNRGRGLQEGEGDHARGRGCRRSRVRGWGKVARGRRVAVAGGRREAVARGRTSVGGKRRGVGCSIGKRRGSVRWWIDIFVRAVVHIGREGEATRIDPLSVYLDPSRTEGKPIPRDLKTSLSPAPRGGAKLSIWRDEHFI